MHAKLMTLVLVLAAVALGTSALAQDPIAHYPLVSDAADATGNNGDMELEDCPFQDGGVYCNGSFWDFTCITPFLNDMDFSLFAIAVDFKIENYHSVNMPVIWTGYAWRNLGFEISPDGYAGVTTGSGDAFFVPSDVIVTLGEWHTAVVSYNESMGFVSCYLDDEIITVAERDPFNPASDKRVIPKNGSYGRAFEGILRNLYVYNTDDPDVVAIEAMSFGQVKSLFR